MVIKELTKDDIINILFHLEDIGYGSYGIIKKVDNDTCIKIYYKDIYNTYIKHDINCLDDEIDIKLSVYNDGSEDLNTQEIRDNNRKKLEYLSKIGLIKKVLTYRGYAIGIEMKYYLNYIPLDKAKDFLDKDDYKKILLDIRKKLDELISNNIYPLDLHRRNILINPKDLDIVFIDLDDIYTRYEEDDYLNKKPLVKKNLINTCNKNFNEIERNMNK